MNNPAHELCVLRDDDHTSWVVSICHGQGRREPLARFKKRDEAAEYALAERDRRRAQSGVELTIHFPDDCPCYQSPESPNP
jgi:hypothetical protein